MQFPVGEGDQITTVLLLAAGSGSRLRPLTDDQPKCLTEVDGIPILERLVRCLRLQGINRLVVVLGHQEHRIREFLGQRKEGLTIDYVVNPRYRTTNNIYSLWLARKKIREPFLLVECDLIFDASSLREMFHPDKIAVSDLQCWMDGTTVSIDQFRRVAAFGIGDNNAAGFNYKTVNIYSFSRATWLRVIQRLEQHISDGGAKDFYEVVLAEMVADGSLSFQAVFFDPKSWYEIDTLNDLDNAECLLRANGREQASSA